MNAMKISRKPMIISIIDLSQNDFFRISKSYKNFRAIYNKK